MRELLICGLVLLVLITVLLDERSMCERGEALGPGLPALGWCEARAHRHFRTAKSSSPGKELPPALSPPFRAQDALPQQMLDWRP